MLGKRGLTGSRASCVHARCLRVRMRQERAWPGEAGPAGSYMCFMCARCLPVQERQGDGQGTTRALALVGLACMGTTSAQTWLYAWRHMFRVRGWAGERGPEGSCSQGHGQCTEKQQNFSYAC